jgi:hypothetical protein
MTSLKQQKAEVKDKTRYNLLIFHNETDKQKKTQNKKCHESLKACLFKTVNHKEHDQ